LFRRQPTTTVVTTPEDEVTANAINMAIEDVLSTRRWEFDLRHDGQIGLKGAHTGSLLLTTTAGSTEATIALAGLANSDLVDPASDGISGYVTRILPTGVSDYANTAMRIASSSFVLSASATITLETKFPTTNSAAAAELHYNEYILPDTVREVVRVSYQEEELNLEQADPILRYDELFPAQNDRTGSPETIAIGGFDTATYYTSIGVIPPGLRMAVWPVPDEDYVLNYSYYRRHPELVAATDTLTGVPQAQVNDIVLQAYSTVAMTWDKDYAAAHFTDLSREQAATKHRAYGGSPGRRHTIRSFENNSGRVHVQRGFPNKVIG
jgi:hypothetical protein